MPDSRDFQQQALLLLTAKSELQPTVCHLLQLTFFHMDLDYMLIFPMLM